MNRVLAIYLPQFSIERLQNLNPERLPDDVKGYKPGQVAQAVVTVALAAGGYHVVRANPQAVERGIRSGQTLAEACAIDPQLKYFDSDPQGDRKAIEKIATWSQCLSPTVHIEDSDCLLVDITGCQRLFAGEENIINRALAGLNRHGYSVRAAIADTPGAAWALAHAAPDLATISPPEHLASSLARLPLWSLRIPSATVDKLNAVGVDSIEALLHMPRSALAARFGDLLLRRLDQTLGAVPELLTAYQPTPLVQATATFTAPTDRLDLILQAIDYCLATFCHQLHTKMAGVRSIYITFRLTPKIVNHKNENPATQTIALELSRPTRDNNRLRTLLNVRIENLGIRSKIESVKLWASSFENLDSTQQSWFDVTDATERDALAELIDRLTVNLPEKSVGITYNLKTYQPESAYAIQIAKFDTNDAVYRRAKKKQKNKTNPTSPNTRHRRTKPTSLGNCFEKTNPNGPSLASADAVKPICLHQPVTKIQNEPKLPVRPLRLLPQPVPVAVTSVIPDGPPINFRYEGTTCQITKWAGPERIETAWWMTKRTQRDYFRVQTTNHHRYWLFREKRSQQWFIHGFFD